MTMIRLIRRNKDKTAEMLLPEAESNFLLEAGNILASSLDYEKTLESVAKLVVPRLADWFSIYLLNEMGNLEIPITAHVDPAKVRWARELQTRYPVDVSAKDGVAEVVRTGKPEMVEKVSQAFIRERVTDPERLKLLDELDLNSYMIVPLTAHHKTVGALSFVMAGSTRRYQQKDLVLGERLAQKIASAIDNARLYHALEKEVNERRVAERELQKARAELERRVAERTRELQQQTEFSDTLLRAQSDLGDGVAVVDADTQKFLYVNNALCDIYGYSRDELLALPSFFSIVPEEDMPALKAQLRARLRGGSPPDHYEIAVRHKNGSRVYVEVSVKQIKDAKTPTLIAIIRDITSRTEAADALRAQEKRLQEAQLIAQTGSWQWDAANGAISLSDEMYHIYGLKKGSPISYDTFLKFIHPQDREFVDQTVQAAFSARMPFKFDFRIVRSDGVERTLHGRGEFSFDASGTVTGVYGTGQDITERKYLERNLRKWMHVFQHARWGLVVGSPDGKKLELLNPALAAMFGYTVEELLGKPVETLLTPVSRKEHPKNVQTIRAQGHHLWEAMGQKKDGTEFPIQVDLTVVKEIEKPLYYIGSVRDLTHSKIIEAELQRSHEELEQRVEERTAELAEAVIKIDKERAKDEALLGSIGDAVIAVDKEGKIMFVNRITETIYGFSQKEMLGKLVSDALPVADASEHILSLQDGPLGIALRSGKQVTGNFYYVIRADGSKLPISITAAPIVLDGDVVGAIGVYRDITKEREVDRAKSEFVALASHQLRTPLTITSWYTEKLIDNGRITQSADEKKYLDQLYRANKRMIDLVNALLDVSRIELGTLAIEPIETDFAEMAESVLGELAPQISTKQLQIERQYDPKLPRIRVDQKLLRIIFQNLFSNATKYIDHGGKITIGLSRQKTEALILVTDTGYGVPAHQQSKLFTKLFRADNAREKESDGTGLGLYIVKSIMEQAGGKVWFESQEGKGSTFYVTLPLKGMAKKSVNKKEPTASR